MRSDWARYWSMDLHVHTPGSQDADAKNYGSAADIVQAAIAAGLDAIAITDHNTSSWCKRVADAAEGTPLIVLPGVEISTAEGHLLAIWEEGTDSAVIDELLVLLGIGHGDRGKLDVASGKGFAESAVEIEHAGGTAIAAHVDKPKGLLKLTVRAQLKKALLCNELSAVEVVHMDTISEIASRVAGERTLACVRGSDTWDAARNQHSLSGIGSRRTWVKASRPDLVGIRHAFADPELRISLSDPTPTSEVARIESIEMIGGFLGGERIELSPDLNCLLGGTGTGKSLLLESVRFALDQQTDRTSFPAIRDEIDSRMKIALVEGSVVRLVLAANGKRYKVERSFQGASSPGPQVFQQTSTDWVEIDLDPAALCPLAAFSQGEIIEYSREPVGRMTLVDSGLDLGAINKRIDSTIDDLRGNGRNMIEARSHVRILAAQASQVAELKEQVRKLSDVFNTDAVKEQGRWASERTALLGIKKGIASLEIPSIPVPKTTPQSRIDANKELFDEVSLVVKGLQDRVMSHLTSLEGDFTQASTDIAALEARWTDRFDEFKLRLDEELEKAGPDGASLTALRKSLEQLQGKLNETQAAKTELDDVARPYLAELEEAREKLIQDLHNARKERRDLRRERVAELNEKAAGFVKLDVPNESDASEFRDALEKIKVGSHVREDFLNSLALKTHPLKFARSLWSGRSDEIVDPDNGIDATNVAKLLANIDDRDLWVDLLDTQAIDRPDVLTIKFKKPDEDQYTTIEELAHGQRCTAILVILLADGLTPVLVDQPEDALHAPWIEEYLVDRLRSLRGSRQYIFATRSPGIVVSGDAEQIITMRATAGHGEVEASGSLERYELNRLALDHLEGGPVPFSRRAMKLRTSVDRKA